MERPASQYHMSLLSHVDCAAAEALYRIPELSTLGPLFRTSKAAELTEAELEYLGELSLYVCLFFFF